MVVLLLVMGQVVGRVEVVAPTAVGGALVVMVLPPSSSSVAGRAPIAFTAPSIATPSVATSSAAPRGG